MNELEDELRRRFGKVQKRLIDSASLAFMGDASGNLSVTGMPGYVWVRMDGSPAIPVFNKTVAPSYNQAVMVGYTALEPNLLQVISGYSGQSSIDPATAFSAVGPHAASHFLWGGDPGFWDKRQLLAGRIGPAGIAGGGSTAYLEIYPDIVTIAGTECQIAHQYVDLSSYVPTSGSSRWVAVTVSGSGQVGVTSGSISAANPPPFSLLPAAPDGSVLLGYVRLYCGMTALAEGMGGVSNVVSTDILDTRSMLPPAGGPAPGNVQYLTLATTAGLPNFRKLVAGSGIGFSDGGAGGNLIISSTGSGASGSGSGHVIQNSGSALATEPNLDFTGNGVVAANYPTGNASRVTIPGLSVYSSGSLMPFEKAINFSGFTVADVSGSGWTQVTAGSSGSQLAGHTVYASGSPMTQRAGINFAGTGVTVTDVSGSGWTLVTITGGSSGSSIIGHVIQDEGVARTQRAALNFVGAGVTAVDNAGNDSTDVTISGMSGSGLSSTVAYFDSANTITSTNFMRWDSANHRLSVSSGSGLANSTLQVAGSLSLPYNSYGSDGTLAAVETDTTIEFTSSGSLIVTLPTATTCRGRIYAIKNGTGGSAFGWLQVATTSSQYIDSLHTYTFTVNNESIILQSNGTNWRIIGRYMP